MAHLTKFKTSLIRKIPSNLQWMLYTCTHTAYVKFWIYYNEKKKPKNKTKNLMNLLLNQIKYRVI